MRPGAEPTAPECFPLIVFIVFFVILHVPAETFYMNDRSISNP